METLIYVAFQILKFFLILIALSMVLELSLTGSVTLTAFNFIADLVAEIVSIPFQLMDFLACVMFQIIDFIIEAIWDMVPAVSDVVSAPSASDLFNAC